MGLAQLRRSPALESGEIATSLRIFTFMRSPFFQAPVGIERGAAPGIECIQSWFWRLGKPSAIYLSIANSQIGLAGPRLRTSSM